MPNRWVWSPLTLAMFCTCAAAQDFRKADMGARCDNIAAQEAQLGSKPIVWGAGMKELVAFEGTEFGREVSIVYYCSNGVLHNGFYFLPKENFEDALRSLRSLYDQLVSTQGKPPLDNTPWQKDADPRGIQSDPHQYFALWRGPRTSTSIMIMPVSNVKESWQVMVDISRSRTMSSPDMERHK